MKQLLLGLFLILGAHSAAAAEYWYYCDPAHAYYPYVRACTAPWRQVVPYTYGQPGSQQSQAPAPPIRQVPAGSTPPSVAFRQGQADRQTWESWFGKQTGDYRTGAEYRAGHRSVPNPGPCGGAGSPATSVEWTAGCLAAQQKLAAPDVRRKTESEYRLGWNNPPSAASSAAPAQTADDERAHEPQPFVVAINTSVSGGASPVIQGTTNLPDGTILWVRLWPPFPACFGHCEPVTVPTGSGHDDAVGGGVIVKSGEFIAGPAWQTDWPLGNGTGQLNPGRYILEVSFWAVEPDPSQQRQPASVKAVLGAHGEYMRGQLVGGCCFGYGSPGRAATQADAQKESGDAHAMSAFYGPGVYYARYVDVP